uniref:Acyl-CoA thioesterase 2 n=1 Tax=Nothobranchius korthausae TaxID=1143690 RepID=A0A1A8FPN4_9TELE
MSSQVRLRLLPSARCLYDEPIQVKVTGLRSRQEVTMRARSTDEKGVMFSSSATYRADGNGEIDLNRDPSIGGSFHGVEPMGLLWSMRPHMLHKKFQKSNSLNPHVVKFSVHEEADRMLAEAINERFLLGDGVSRVPVRHGAIRGALFSPPGAGPFPAVLDLYTFGGGLSERRAALLASRGFLVLTVALYGHDDQPQNVTEVHLDHFEDAVIFLKQLPKVGGKGVGIISRSKGGDIALSLAAFVPGVEVVVWINGCSANVGIPLCYKNHQILTPLGFDFNKVIPTTSGANMIKCGVGNPLLEENKGSVVPIERANCRFLFAASEDDLNWDSKAYMDNMVERLKLHGKDNFESVSYPGAGHMLEPPYGPFCSSALHGMLSLNVMWGGEPKVHTAAEVHLWKKIQEILRAHLSCDAAQTKSNL